MIDDRLSVLLADLQTEILERVAYGEPASVVTAEICERAEALARDAICTVLTIDRDRRLRHLAAPSLPMSFALAIDGIAIGPDVGSCGTAAFLGQPIESIDIETDPAWADYKALPLEQGLRACWSSPITARDGRVIGTFGFYFRQNRRPTPMERLIVARCTHLCAIAIERDEIQRHIAELACLDRLTGLPNRASFNDRMSDSASSPRARFALLLADIDHLKEINDTLGHAGGDALIRAVSDRLARLPDRMHAFRIGGDEFAVIVEGCADATAMHEAAAAVMAAMDEPLLFAGQTIPLAMTLGAALCHGICDPDTLYQNADFALYRGKENGRAQFVAYEPQMREVMVARIRVIREMGEALDSGRLIPFYQPIVRIDTAEIVGVEALARVRRPNGDIVSPGEFQHAMTDPRVALGVTRSMVDQVARDIRRWIDIGIPFQHVGFNVGGADFQAGNLDEVIVGAFERHGVPLSHMILEVNETTFMGGRDNLVARSVEGLRAKGMRVALDDFGTGHASLTHLLHFPVDILKIDKSFVDCIVDDRPSAAIVEALVRLARELSMRLVAEGIETGEQAERLLALGCTLGQGYRYARPGSATATTELLKRFMQRPKVAAMHHDLPFRITA